jgi:hypothetical protein
MQKAGIFFVKKGGVRNAHAHREVRSPYGRLR